MENWEFKRKKSEQKFRDILNKYNRNFKKINWIVIWRIQKKFQKILQVLKNSKFIEITFKSCRVIQEKYETKFKENEKNFSVDFKI